VSSGLYSGALDGERVPGVMFTSRTEIDPVDAFPSKTPVGEADEHYNGNSRTSIPAQQDDNYQGWDHGLDP